MTPKQTWSEHRNERHAHVWRCWKCAGSVWQQAAMSCGDRYDVCPFCMPI